MKESFYTALTAVVIVLVVVLLVWVPLKLIPKLFSSGSSYLATSLTSTFIPSTSTPTQNTPAKQTPTTNVYNTYNSYGTTTTSSASASNVVTAVNVNGRPDLAIRLIAVGTIDRYTKQLSQSSYTNATDETGIKFEVVNIGNGASGVWSFSATLPSATTPNYQSDSQISLNPGDKIQYVLGFDNPVYSGTNSAYITINPLIYSTDSDTSNNSLTVPITIVGTTNYNYSNTNPGYTNTVYPNNNNVYPYGFTNNPSYTNNTIYPSYNYTNTVYPNTTYPYGIVPGNGYTYNYGYNNGANTYNYSGGTTYTWTSLSGTCYANPATAYTGQAVTWNADGSGGNGYYSYSWVGTDNLLSTDKSPVKVYNLAGTKTASVTITSNGTSVTKQCTMSVYDQYNNNGVSGATDLSVSLIGVGMIDSSGQFIQTTQIPRGSSAAIKVRVSNIGSTYSGPWSIVGTISPSLIGYTYRQDNQMSLVPGATSDYTIVFSNPQSTGINTFNIQVTPSVTDSNSYNNSLTTSITLY